jgi:hypothetical protein
MPTPDPAQATPRRPARPLGEVLVVMLQLGTVAFGGPAVLVAMLWDETVRRRHWLADAEFLDVVGVVSVLGDPSSTQLAIVLPRAAGGLGRAGAGRGLLRPAAMRSCSPWPGPLSATVPGLAGHGPVGHGERGGAGPVLEPSELSGRRYGSAPRWSCATAITVRQLDWVGRYARGSRGRSSPSRVDRPREMSRIVGSAGSPKGSVQSSTPFAAIMRSASFASSRTLRPLGGALARLMQSASAGLR